MTRRLVLRLLQVLLGPLLLACALERRFGSGERVFVSCGELVALVPGWPGSMARKAFYAATLRSCAERAYIGFGTVVTHRGASVGDDVYIGPYGVIGTARIGDGVKIASRVSILSGRHQHEVVSGFGASSLPALSEVTIGAGAWIGEGAIVMADVGPRSVVGAKRRVLTASRRARYSRSGWPDSGLALGSFSRVTVGAPTSGEATRAASPMAPAGAARPVPPA